MNSSLLFTTWFHHPAVVMDGFEVLSRASAFVVRSRGNLHIIASQHVTRPFAFPQYYAPERFPFVHVLGAEHVRCTVSARGADAPVALRPRPLAHPNRDLAVAHAVEDAQLDALLEAGTATALTLDARELTEGEALEFHGHVGNSDGGEALVPRVVSGAFLASSGVQCFARTAEELQTGMCGGPVMDGRGRCVGVVEGVVPCGPAVDCDGSGDAAPDVRQRAARLLRGAAVFIPACDVVYALAAAEARLRAAAAGVESRGG